MDEKISVVIPTYNKKSKLLMALGSVFNQAYPLEEIIIVDDDSTDNTQKAVDELKEKSPWRLRYFNQKHSGPATARNYGVKNASSEIILVMDSDIILRQDSIRKGVSEFKNVDGVYALCPIHAAQNFVSKVKNDELVEGYVKGELPPSACFMIQKDTYEHVGGFPDFFYFAGGEDIIFFSKILEKKLEIKSDSDNQVLHDDDMGFSTLIKSGVRYGRALYLLSLYAKKSWVGFYLRYCLNTLRDLINAIRHGLGATIVTVIELPFTHYGFFVEMVYYRGRVK